MTILPREPLSPEDHRHGTYNGYNNWGCRCEACKAANAEQTRKAQARRKQMILDPADPRHGTENFYGNYGCRCERCTAEWSAASVERARRRAARRAA